VICGDCQKNVLISERFYLQPLLPVFGILKLILKSGKNE